MMTSSRLFTWRQVLIYTTVFVGVVIIIQRVLRYVSEHVVAFDNPYYWPVSIFGPRFRRCVMWWSRRQ